MKFKFYSEGAVSRGDLEIVRSCIALLKYGQVYLPRRLGYDYALYIRGKASVLDHNYYENIYREIDGFEFCDSIEVFFRRQPCVKFRIIASREDLFVPLPNGELLRYKHVPGKGGDLVVYFDYSRLVEKVDINEEYLPRFGFKSDKNILVLSNTFGYWGTSCLFDSDGNFIRDNVVAFISDLMARNKYGRLFFVGGSQGATAALFYASCFRETEAVFAACPVEANVGNMLKHLVSHIRIDHLDVVINSINRSLAQCNVFLYSTTSDAHHPYHNILRYRGGKNVSYFICEDPSVGHGDCLRYYIKNIYRQIGLM